MGYHTTPHVDLKDTYRLVYGADVVIPIELLEPTPSTITMTEKSNEDARRVELDPVEEEREKAKIKQEATKQQMARKYNKKVNPQEFEEGDLVLRKVELVRKLQRDEKLAPNWEMPYRVIQKIRRRVYKIVELGGRELSRTWNVSSLCNYFS